MNINAVALRAITHAGDSFAKGDVILGMSSGQFADWSADDVGMVREATATEVARAKGSSATVAAKPKRPRKPNAAAKPAAADADPASPPAADA